MKGRVIWVFREPRSGSSWFTSRLANTLDRQYYFFDDMLSKKMIDFNQRLEYFLHRKQEPDDVNKLLNTHHFFGLQSMSNYTDPILIRVTRKNKVEHFCSIWISRNIVGKFYNVHNEYELSKYPEIKPVEIPYKHVYQYIDKIKINEQLWNTYATGYENETVTYEQLLDNFSSTLLPIENWSMQVPQEGLSIKLPYNKKEVIINYSFIENIIRENLDYK